MLVLAKLTKKFPSELEGSLSCAKEPDVIPYPVPTNPAHILTPQFLKTILILSLRNASCCVLVLYIEL
jgi:hypothetical protein